MTNFIPIFPLGIVIYPGESLNLHIFEPRYKQLIAECNSAKKLFGIPAVIDKKLQDYGTLTRLDEITEIHENGEMDIKTTGEKVFRAIVTYPENHEEGNPELMRRVINSIYELHRLLNVQKDFKKEAEQLNAYDVAHHIGLSLQEEYELLNLFDERQRQEYLKRHLAKVIPMVAEMEQLKVKVKLNGHFKNLAGFDFNL
jgi:Lon protease-like protein